MHLRPVADPVTGLWGMGGDLGETRGMVPQNIRWGDGPCIRPPIFGEVLLSQVRREKKQKFFVCEKTEKKAMTKKRPSEIFGVKMEFFS